MNCTNCGEAYPLRTTPNPCGDCRQMPDNCNDAVQIAWVPGTACTIGVTFKGITSTLPLTDGIKNCETDTRIDWDNTKKCINFWSERYINGVEGSYLQTICASQIASGINLGDLSDVDDNALDPDHCSLLVYRKNNDCGENCKGVNDVWAPWTVANNKANYLSYVMGFNDDGCPIALDKPDTTSQYHFLMWRGDNKVGYIQPGKVEQIPKDENGRPLVVGLDKDGKPVVGPFDFAGMFDESEETYFDPAPGFKIMPNQGNSVIYYKNRKQMTLILDLGVTAPREAGGNDKLHIATIHDPRFFPDIGDEDYIDLPIHACWNTWSDFNPVALKIDNKGRLLLSGTITARSTGDGPKEVMVNGIDDVVAWFWKG